MATEIFPVEPVPEAEGTEALPRYTDVRWDFDGDRPVFAHGAPVLCDGADAVAVWCWNALKTARYRWAAFARGYGCEIGRAIGASYASETRRSEAKRYLIEAVTCSPYVEGAEVTGLTLEGSELHAEMRISTIYGEATLYV